MTDVTVYDELVLELTQLVVELGGQLEAYREVGLSNKSAAARARKLTLEVDKIGKEFRKASVAFHK